jgi:two-component system sensor histidine kinase KdpD
VVRDELTFQIGGHISGLLTVILITAVYHLHANTTTVVLTYLLAILVASTFWGLGVSVFMSVLSALCVDYYFLPPLGTFNISDTQDWVALVSFLVTSVIGSDLSARARRQAQEAKRQRNEVSRLYEFSQRLLIAQSPGDLWDEIPVRILHLFGGVSAALFLSKKQTLHRAGKEIPELDAAHLKSVQEYSEFANEYEQKTCYCPVRGGSEIIGSLGVFGSTVSRETLEAVAALAASAIDRINAIELLGKAEATRESPSVDERVLRMPGNARIS